ncbi:hypothetical protein CBR_g29818 [Chara braunii]|uniref:6-phosphogluconate dehydrogenase NADP-binding domain-containing protein n=1 Tax=Chara braunii TaxID=69332 RepID=A0A388LBH6_CHABU|nr:hypothetical protein CBR_g29818 [Chara braunii]|eukprot:GBG79670.1 hypothetical protein CBR_g29818 [Chara braunii]
MEWSGRKAMAMAVTSTFRVGFIGLGAMGSGMAATLVGKGFKVCGYDVYEPSMAKMREKGMSTATSCAEAASGAQVLVVMVTNSDQAESALFGPKGAMDVLPSRACIVMCSTVAAAYVRGLDHRLRGAGREWEVVDAPVSGGVVKAANGTLTIMASGSEEGLRRADSVLRAMSEKLYIIPGGVGAGSNVKMVNQLLAGVHIVASAEAMALGARCGLDTRLLYEIISNAAGNSW